MHEAALFLLSATDKGIGLLPLKATFFFFKFCSFSSNLFQVKGTASFFVPFCEEIGNSTRGANEQATKERHFSNCAGCSSVLRQLLSLSSLTRGACRRAGLASPTRLRLYNVCVCECVYYGPTICVSVCVFLPFLGGRRGAGTSLGYNC